MNTVKTTILATLGALALGAGSAHVATASFGVPSAANLALGGDGVLVLREGIDKGPTLSRLVAGQAPQAVGIPTVPADGGGGGIFSSLLYASPTAIALSIAPVGGGETRSYVGPASGPLRRVAACPAEDRNEPLPVAVDGGRVGWIEGGCEQPDRSYGAATVVVAGADPAVPARRLAMPPNVEPVSLALGAAGDRVSYMSAGAKQPTVAAVGADAVNLLFEQTPFSEGQRLLGTGPDGATFLADESSLNYYMDCTDTVFRAAAGATAEVAFPTAGCLGGISSPLTPGTPQTGAAFAPNRIVSLVLAKGSSRRSPKLAITAAPLAGGPATTLVPLKGRRPQRLAADATRIAYTVDQCVTAGPVGKRVSVVVTDGRRPTLPDCSFRVRSDTLRRDDKTKGSVAVSCPLGCRIDAVRTKNIEQGFSEFADATPTTIQPGKTARASVNLASGTKAGSRVSVLFDATNGPAVLKRMRVGR